MFLFLFEKFRAFTIFKINKTFNFISLKEKVTMKNLNRKHIYYICNFTLHIYIVASSRRKSVWKANDYFMKLEFFLFRKVFARSFL